MASHISTNNPVIDLILIGYIFACEILSWVIVATISGIGSTLSIMAAAITILLGIINFTIAYPKLKQRLGEISQSKVWISIKGFFGR